jgi:hypothetical protein
MPASIRKFLVSIEETHGEMERPVSPPAVKIAIAAAVKNPFAGKYVGDLTPLYDLGAEVADILTRRALDILKGMGDEISAYGKGAIVGTGGELEHAAAVLHPRFGKPVRTAIGGGKSIIPSTKKVAGPGAVIAMPLVNRNDIWAFDDMDAIEIAIPDAPRADEVVIALAFGLRGRPHKRTKAD